MDEMRVVVTGSRGWKDEAKIRSVLMVLKRSAEHEGRELVVVHGHCPQGADKIADAVCDDLGIRKIRVPAAWNRHGRAAGFIRNQQMIDEYEPELGLAFRAGGKSNGTDDMIKRLSKAQIECVTYAA